jgi:hypothetical protein
MPFYVAKDEVTKKGVVGLVKVSKELAAMVKLMGTGYSTGDFMVNPLIYG